MAGSYRHIADKDNNFLGIDFIDNLGDAYEALEDCYKIIKHLSNGDKRKIFNAHESGALDSYPHYKKDWIEKIPYEERFERYWED